MNMPKINKALMREISQQTFYRELSFTRDDIDEDKRLASVAFSSEEPVARGFGNEVLDHSIKSVNLGRLRNGGAVLWNHDPDQLIGVVEKASIDDDRRGRAVVRFADTPDAENVWQKVRQGIARQISVGYRIDKLEKESEDETGPTYRVTKWTPHEVSFVSIGADSTTQVGRDLTYGESEMTDKTDDQKPSVENEGEEERSIDTGDIARKVADELRGDAEAKAEAENTRCESIRALGVEHQRETLAITAIEQGKTIEQFRDDLLAASKETVRIPVGKPETRVESNYQHGKLKAFKTDKDSLETAYRAGKWVMATVFGNEDARRWCKDYGVRVMTGIGTGDSAVVPEEMVQPIIDLREEYSIARQYCHVHPMSSDTANVPRRKSGVTAYFAARGDATTASDAEFDSIELVANEVSALTRVSKSYSEDAVIDLGDFLTREMAYAFAVKEDDCLFNGDGTSTYGGVNGIRNKILTLVGAVDAASDIDTFAEVTVTDLVTAAAALPMFPGIAPSWFASKRGAALTFGRLGAAGGGNTKADLASGVPNTWDGDRVVLTQSMPTSAGDLSNVVMLVYGDLDMGVVFGDRRGFEVQILTERYAEFRQVGVLASTRFDINVHGIGDGTNAGPIVALVGE